MISMHDCQIQDSYCSHILSFLNWSVTFTRATCWWSPIPPSWAINIPCVQVRIKEAKIIRLTVLPLHSGRVWNASDPPPSDHQVFKWDGGGWRCHPNLLWPNSQLWHRTNVVIASWQAGSLRLSSISFASRWRPWWSWLTRAVCPSWRHMQVVRLWCLYRSCL
mgnify:CR=1 FL=1